MCVLGNFQKFWEPRFKVAEPVFWGVVFNPRRVREYIPGMITGGSDTRTTSVGTTAISHSIVFFCRDINALGWDPRVLFWRNLELWRPVLFFSFSFFFPSSLGRIFTTWRGKKKKKLQRDFFWGGETGVQFVEKI